MKKILFLISVLFVGTLVAQPTITNFYPKKAKGGDKVTIIGTNFNATSSNNVVWLGGAKCVIQSATTTKLIITLPNSVTHNFFQYTNIASGLSCYSRNKLIPYFTNSGGYSYGSTSFNTGVSYTTGGMSQNTASYANKFTTFDQDDDGKIDILIFNGQALDVYDNVFNSGTWGSSSFSKNTIVSNVSLLSSGFTMDFGNTLISDLDGDGDLDAVGGCPGYVAKRIFKNTSSTSLSYSLQTNNNSSYDNTLIAADLNNDGLIDLGSHYMISNSGHVWCENTYAGSNANIGMTQWYTSLTNSPTVQVLNNADFDKNGKVDMVFGISGGFVIGTNNTTANAAANSFSWSYSSTTSTSTMPRCIVIADFNNDSLEDVFTCGWSNTVNFFKNTSSSSISFASTVTATCGTSGSCLGATAADMNNDGLIDILVSHNNGIYLIPNSTSGSTLSFGTPILLGSAGANLEDILAVDLDGDGLLDIVGHNGNTTLKVLINQLNNTPTISTNSSISSFNACSGSASDNQSFTISGSKLTANISVTCPTGFQISTSSSTGFGTSLTLAQSSGTVNSTTVYVRLASTATGSPSGNISITSTGATSQTIAVSGSVNALPTISGTLSVNVNSTTQLTGSGTANNTDPWISSNTSVATINSSGLVSGLSGGNTTITYTNNLGCSQSSSVTVNAINFYIKSSGVNALTTLSNWSSNSDGTGSNPSSFSGSNSFNLSNSSNSTSFSIGSSDWTLTRATLIIPSGATLTVPSGRTLTLSGASISNSGTIDASSGNITISGSGNNTLNGTVNVGTLTTNTSSNLTVGASATLNIYTALNLTSIGTLTTNSNVFLKSNSSGTARMGAVSGNISGNMNCELYVAGGYRKFRFLAHPFSTTQGLSILTDDIDITGSGGSNNGFTSSGTNNPSAFWYNPTNGDGANYDAGWTEFTSTSSGTGNNWAPGQGIIVMMRGSKGEGLDGGSYTPSAVTLDMSGSVNTGNVTVNLDYSGTGNSKGLNLLGNPYPSPIDVSGLVHGSASSSKINKTVYTRNSRQGSYRTDAISSGTSYSVPAYAAFFLKTNASTSSVTFTESMKQTSSAISTFLGGGEENTPNFMRISALINNEQFDKVDFYFGNQYSDTFDTVNDAFKLTNDYFNLYSLTSDNSKVAIDFRNLDTTKLIPLGLGIAKNATDTVNLFFDANNSGSDLYLYDFLTKEKTRIQTGGNYELIVNANSPETLGENRLVIGSISALNSLSTKLEKEWMLNLYPNPANEYLNIESYNISTQVQASIQSASGLILNSFNLDFSNNHVQKLDVYNLSPGIYFIELKDFQGRKLVKRFIK